MKFLQEYLASLTAAYKGDEANTVAEAILDGKEETFAADSTLHSFVTKPVGKLPEGVFQQVF